MQIYKIVQCENNLNEIGKARYYINNIDDFFILKENLKITYCAIDISIADLKKTADENGHTWRTVFKIHHSANEFFGFKESVDTYYIIPIKIENF